jgi:hypothetical protein
MVEADTRCMARPDHKQPWWERPAKEPGEPRYEQERERLRAELARARRADRPERRPDRAWMQSRAPRAA